MANPLPPALALSCWFLCHTAIIAGPSVLLIAGPKSHAPGEHEHPAGCELLAKYLETSGLGIQAEVSLGWPQDAAKAAAADTLVIYCDGQDAHVANGHLPELRQRLAAGKGLVLLHYALEPADAEMAAFFDQAIGGHFQVGWSVNPVWQMKDPLIAEHPITRGVKPFTIEDEFYYHIKFRDDRMISLLGAIPPPESLGADGPRSGNPTIRKKLQLKEPQTLAWAVVNPGKGRGIGFTGAHFHRNWTDDSFRKLVLNAIVWTAGAEVPAEGVAGHLPPTPAYQTIDQAIAKGDLNDVRIHLQVDPARARQATPPNSRPPLEQAIMRNKQEIALLLLASGADPNSNSVTQRTPLHLAVERNNSAVVIALLKAGAKPNARDKDGWTPLHHAAAKNQLSTAQALLANGADPMILSELRGTPLHEAAVNGSADLIRLLLDHKVDPAAKSTDGVTALDLAQKYQNQPAIDILSGR